MWSSNPDPSTHHAGMQNPLPPQTPPRTREAHPMGKTHENFQRHKQMITFIKRSNAFDKQAIIQDPNTSEQRRRGGEARQEDAPT